MRSKYRKPKRRRSGSFGWNVAIAVVVIVGVVAVVLTRGGGDSAGSGPPRAADAPANVAGDHWHAALDVNICGEWLEPAPAFEKPFDSPNPVANAGIHSHGDGLIHIHPFVVSEEGNNATIGKFFDYGGWGLSSDSIDLGGANARTRSGRDPRPRPSRRRGATATCARSASTRARRSSSRWAVNGKKQTGNPADYEHAGRRDRRDRLAAQGCRDAVPAGRVHARSPRSPTPTARS